MQSEGVSRSGRPWEVESTRQHIRLALENWEKQFADVFRYERAQLQDSANMAAMRRALARFGASLGIAVTALTPVFTNSADLQAIGVGPTTIGNALVLIGGASLATSIGSVWWAGILLVNHRRSRKSRLTPLSPPGRLDAMQIGAIIEDALDVPYYRERDVDPGPHFGWKAGRADLPELPEE